MSDALHIAPPRNPARFWALMFGTCAAPIFWLGQLILGFGVTAEICYRGDHPSLIASGTALRTALIAFDAIAIVVALAGGIVSLTIWRVTREEKQAASIAEGRAHFMAQWGIWSSACFLIAIGFETIASIAVPLCTR
jgi:hypothetical protein